MYVRVYKLSKCVSVRVCTWGCVCWDTEEGEGRHHF